MSVHPSAHPPTRREVHFGGRIVRCFVERPRSLNQLLADAAALRPDGEALVCGEARLTYAAFDRRVALLAGALAARGLGRGDRIVLGLGNGIAFPVLAFAAARLGAVIVPLNPREGTAEMRHVLADCGASVFVHSAEMTPRLPDLNGLPQLAHIIPLGADEADSLAALSDAPPCLVPAAVEEDDVAAILYTSGTTGRPKGAMLTHLGIVHSSMHYVHEMQLGPNDRSILTVPFSHVTGFVAALATLVRAAGTLVILPAFKADAFLRLAAAERMTHTIMVPAMFNLCLLNPLWREVDLSAWRVSGFGGALMPVQTLAGIADRLPNLRLVNSYGATETSSPAVLMPPVPFGARREWAGLPVPCDEVLVMDADGQEVPPGTLGELWLGGPNVAKGYWNNPEATEREFVHGFWKSGDLGMRDEDGFVRVVDRIKDVVNRGGYKIPSAEVEGALLDRPDIAEAAVVGRPCPVLGERVHAFVVARGDGVDVEAARTWCAAQLADYKVPETITVLDGTLPRSANGKVLKRHLRELASSPTGNPAP